MGRARRRLVLITGAAGGIGRATAGVFRDAGWQVVGVDRRSVRGLLEADLSQAGEIEALCARLCARYTRLDALIHNAAEQACRPLMETAPQVWDRVMAVNVRAAYLLAVCAHPLLRAARGSLVNVASVHAVATSRGLASYAASKGALVALTRSLALEFAGDGIRANAVLPGAVDTPMLAAGLQRHQAAGTTRGTAAARRALEARHPLGRVGRPEEIAEAIYFLADRARSSFITGQTLVVDGGALARLSTE